MSEFFMPVNCENSENKPSFSFNSSECVMSSQQCGSCYDHSNLCVQDIKLNFTIAYWGIFYSSCISISIISILKWLSY